jgi:hypothetical protein
VGVPPSLHTVLNRTEPLGSGRNWELLRVRGTFEGAKGESRCRKHLGTPRRTAQEEGANEPSDDRADLRGAPGSSRHVSVPAARWAGPSRSVGASPFAGGSPASRRSCLPGEAGVLVVSSGLASWTTLATTARRNRSFSFSPLWKSCSTGPPSAATASRYVRFVQPGEKRKDRASCFP